MGLLQSCSRLAESIPAWFMGHMEFSSERISAKFFPTLYATSGSLVSGSKPGGKWPVHAEIVFSRLCILGANMNISDLKSGF